MIKYESPANTEPGMIRLALDAKGRLMALEARPPASRGPKTSTQDNAAKPPNWTALFAAAGLDPARFQPVAPQRTPPMAFDADMAWLGTFAEGRPEQIRVETASWEGRPVFFDITGDWQHGDTSAPAPFLPFFVVFLTLVLVAAAVARHNLQLGRGDRRGSRKNRFRCFPIRDVYLGPHRCPRWRASGNLFYSSKRCIGPRFPRECCGYSIWQLNRTPGATGRTH